MNSKTIVPHQGWCDDNQYEMACERFGIPFNFISRIEMKRELLKKLLEIEINKNNSLAVVIMSQLYSRTEAELDESIAPLLYEFDRTLFEPRKRERKPENFILRTGRILRSMRLNGLNVTEAAKEVGRRYKDNYTTKTRRNKFFQDRKMIKKLESERDRARAEIFYGMLESAIRNDDGEDFGILCWYAYHCTELHEAEEANDRVGVTVHSTALDVVLDHPKAAKLGLLYIPLETMYDRMSDLIERMQVREQRETLLQSIGRSDVSEPDLIAAVVRSLKDNHMR